jgi:hypothetical protein
MDILSIAFYLSVLSYCLGVLLRALPLPFFTVKRLGKTLIVDSVFSATLVFLYQTLTAIVDYLGRILGADWTSFSMWVSERSTILLLLLTAFKAIGVLASRVGLGAVFSGILSSITNLITTSLTTLLTVWVLSLMLKAASGFLIAVGVLLISIPFRLARGAGAMIIAVTMVFSIGMPLMPHFISIVSSGTAISIGLREPLCSGTLYLVDAKGNPVGQAVIEGYRGEEFLYRYVFSTNGLLVLDKTNGGFPCSEHIARLEIAGFKYSYSVPAQSITELANITFSLPDLLVLDTRRLVEISEGVQVVDYSKSENSLVLRLDVSEEAYFAVYTETSDTLEVIINGEAVNASSVFRYTWYNISYTGFKYTLVPGTYQVNITVYTQSTTPLDVPVEPFVIKAFNVDPFAPETTLAYLTYLFVELTILPLIYVAILMTISYGVSRLLGGVSVSIARYMVMV